MSSKDCFIHTWEYDTKPDRHSIIHNQRNRYEKDLEQDNVYQQIEQSISTCDESVRVTLA